MKILKRVLLVLLIIIAIPFIIALFVSNDFQARSTILIDKPREEVFEYVRQVSNQEDFGVWFKMDPDIKLISEGTDGTEGFVLRWESDVVGNGSQTITRIVGQDSIISKLDFGFGDPPTGYFALRPMGDSQTEVTWGIKGRTPYPWNFMSLFVDMNKEFEVGVSNLKKEMEGE